MEKRQSKQHYLPFAKARLGMVDNLLQDWLEPAGNYKSPTKGQKKFFYLFSKILKTGTNIIRPVFSYITNNPGNLLPIKWLPIINYLKEKELIRDFYFDQIYNDIPRYYRTFIMSPIDPKLTDGSRGHDGFTHGDSLELDEAVAKVIGEFLERYPLAIYREKDLLKACTRDLKNRGRNFLDPALITGFSQEQGGYYKNFQFDESSNFLWAAGQSLFTGKKILIPAQLIFWNYLTEHQGWREPKIREANTNGAGGYYTLTRAILSGLYELIQRDGFLIYWLNHQAPPVIDQTTITYNPIRKFLEESQHLGFEVKFYNTTSEINIPSCVCVITDHSGVGPKVSLGAGCGLDWDKIILRSITEAFGVYTWIRDLKDERGQGYFSLDKNYQPFRDKSINQANRMKIWASSEMFKHFQFFINGSRKEFLGELKRESIIFKTEQEELKFLVNKFRSLGPGYEIYYYQAKHQALDDLGYYSVKVVVPELIPLYLNEPYAPLGSRRLKEAPIKLGFNQAVKWNPWPHPFP